MTLSDWEKTNKGKKKFKETRYDSKISGESLSIVYDGKDWRVWESFMGYDEEIGNGFKTEAEAKKTAEKFMRDN